jgi:hypothetical protein
MGNTIWVDVEGRSPGELPADNSIMLRLEKPLAQLSSALNVPKFAEFYAYESGWFQKWRWFEPAKALTAISAIHDHLQHNPGDLRFDPDPSRSHWPEMLMKELLECRRVLEGAASTGRKFRFLIVS